jgi:hypothetical protein
MGRDGPYSGNEAPASGDSGQLIALLDLYDSDAHTERTMTTRLYRGLALVAAASASLAVFRDDCYVARRRSAICVLGAHPRRWVVLVDCHTDVVASRTT